MDFEIGKLSEDVKLTTSFKEYAAEEKSGDIILTAVLSKGEVSKLNRGYGIRLLNGVVNMCIPIIWNMLKFRNINGILKAMLLIGIS